MKFYIYKKKIIMNNFFHDYFQFVLNYDVHIKSQINV
jgi:hypothetical protein